MAQRRASGPKGQDTTPLSAARKLLAETRARIEAVTAPTKSERARLNRALDRSKDRELRAELDELRRAGLYDIKSREGERGVVLTRGRKQRIRSAFKQFEQLQRGTIFAAYPSRKPSEKKKIAAVVKSQGGRATKKGVFVKRDEGEMRRGETRLVREKETGLYKIEQIHRYTDKRGIRRTVKADIYLEGAEALERQEKAMKKRFDKVAANLGPNERIRFTIGGPNGNVSRASFSSWGAFKARVMAYRRDPRAQATFMASLTVYIAAKEVPGSVRYRVPVAWVDRAGRRHDSDPANLYGGELFPMPPKGKSRRTRAKGAKTRQKNKG